MNRSTVEFSKPRPRFPRQSFSLHHFNFMYLSTKAHPGTHITYSQGYPRFNENTCQSQWDLVDFFRGKIALILRKNAATTVCVNHSDRKCLFRRDFLLTLINEQIAHHSDTKKKNSSNHSRASEHQSIRRAVNKKKTDKQTNKQTENSASYGSSHHGGGLLSASTSQQEEPSRHFLCKLHPHLSNSLQQRTASSVCSVWLSCLSFQFLCSVK